MYKENFRELAKERGFFVFDTETTGLTPIDSDIIEFAAIKFRITDNGYEEVDKIDIFIDPGYEIPEIITELTGISAETLKEKGAVKPEEAAETVYSFLGPNPVLMGYNSPLFDEAFVSKLYASAGKDFLPVYDLDVLAMARELLPKPHKLSVVADALEVSDGIQFHTAIDDAKVTFEVYKKLAAMYF